MAMMSNWGMLSIRSERVATFLMDDCPHSASTTAHPPGAPSSPATQHIADVPTHRRPWRSVCNLHRCDDVADSQHTKAEDHRRGHRHVRSHRLHLHPRAGVEADYNKTNQDTRITVPPLNWLKKPVGLPLGDSRSVVAEAGNVYAPYGIVVEC